MPFTKLVQKYSTPRAVQKLLRSLDYNKKNTMRSAECAWKAKSAHCYEAAMLAAAILEERGYPPLVVSIASQDLLDHVIYVFRAGRNWGAIARSRDEGLHGRPAIFRSIRALVLSYYDPFVDDTGRITGYALANLNDCGVDWRRSRKNVWRAEDYLNEIKHTPIHSSDIRYQKLLKRFQSGVPHPKRKFWW